MTFWSRFLVAALLLSLMRCVNSDSQDQPLSERLPHVAAPLDTADADTAVEAASDNELAEMPGDSAGIDWDVQPPRGDLPSAAALRYVRYNNAAFNYSIAYPDTLLRPTDEVGGGRGEVFASRSGDVRMMIYAESGATERALADRYQAQLDERRMRFTYHVLEPEWYLITGFQDGDKIYEKGLLSDDAVVTFRLQYPEEHEDYYDAVAATMGASLVGEVRPGAAPAVRRTAPTTRRDSGAVPSSER